MSWAKAYFQVTLAALLVMAGLRPCPGQVSDATVPITFQNGNTINTSALVPVYPAQGPSSPVDNPIQILGTGGTLIGNNEITFLNPFTGAGSLTIDLTSSNYIEIGYGYYNAGTLGTFSNGFTFQSGETEFEYGTTVVQGALAVTGNSTVEGNVAFTSNNVSGASADTLTVTNGTPTFLGSGSNFTFNSAITSAVILANTSGTQTFGGTIGGNVERLGNGGTSVFSNYVGQILAYGGTVVLNGSTGVASDNYGSAVYLQGGNVVLDNTLVNNNSRIGNSIEYYGGGLSLLGVNGGATTQTLSAPTFSQGLNTISVASGTGAGSSAVLTFRGPPQGPGSVDFEGVNATSQIFFTNGTEGALGAYATVNGTDFATYDTVNGVETMSTTGRPSQVSAATSSTYVLGTGPQNTLSGDVSAAGVTMTTGESLDLGGHTLSLGGWIQNGSAGSITDGTLSQSAAIYFTTNADLSVGTNLQTSEVVKNGAGTLTLTGAPVTSNNYPQFFVDTGTLALNVTTPIVSVQGQSTFVIGDSAGASDSAILSLLGNNQFTTLSTGGNAGDFVGVEIQPAGEFKMNGYDANVLTMIVNGGTVDTGGGTLTTTGITANAISAAGQILNGTIHLVPEGAPYGPANPSSVPISVTNMTYQDGLDISSQVVSSYTVEKTGAGTLVLGNASNSFGNGTIGLILTAGTIALQNSGAAGSTTQEIEFNGGALRADSVGTLTLTNPIIGGGVTTSGSDIVFAGGYTQTAYGGGFGASDTLTIDGYAITGTTNYSSNSGPGTLVLGGTASGTATGTFSQDAGTLAFASDQAIPSAMTIDYNAGIMEAVNGAHTVANRLTLSGDTTFSGSQALTFSATTGNTVDNNSGMVTRTIYVNGTGPVTINNLTNTESSSLVAAGTGTLILSGDPSGFAATRVNAGTLRIKNTDATGASLGTLSVNNSGTFGGTGIVGGATTVASGGTLDPGDQADAAGTLKFKSSLTLNSGSALVFDLGKTTGSDLIQVTGGTFTAPGSGTATIDLRNSGDFGAGLYTLISWTNSSSAAPSDFSLGTTVSGYQYSFSVMNDSLDLTVVAVPEPGDGQLFLEGIALMIMFGCLRPRLVADFLGLIDFRRRV